MKAFSCVGNSISPVSMEKHGVPKETLNLRGWTQKAATSQMLIWKWRTSLIALLSYSYLSLKILRGLSTYLKNCGLGLSVSPLELSVSILSLFCHYWSIITTIYFLFRTDGFLICALLCIKVTFFIREENKLKRHRFPPACKQRTHNLDFHLPDIVIKFSPSRFNITQVSAVAARCWKSIWVCHPYQRIYTAARCSHNTCTVCLKKIPSLLDLKPLTRFS